MFQVSSKDPIIVTALISEVRRSDAEENEGRAGGSEKDNMIQQQLILSWRHSGSKQLNGTIFW